MDWNQYSVCMYVNVCLYSVVHMHRHILLCVCVCVCMCVCICGSCEINGQGLPLCLELIPGCAAQINVQWEQELTIRKVLVHFKPSKGSLLWQTHTTNVNISNVDPGNINVEMSQKTFCNNAWHTCFEQEGNCFMSANCVLVDLLRSD